MNQTTAAIRMPSTISGETSSKVSHHVFRSGVTSPPTIALEARWIEPPIAVRSPPILIPEPATAMLMDMATGRTATDVATMDKDGLLEEIGIPLTPVRLKCAMLGLTTLKVALHKAKGTPLPEGLAGFEDLELT